MMDTQSTILAARAFARNLNILLKTVRLYGFEHGRTAVLLEAAWSELRSALHAAGDTGLLLGVSGTQMLLDGVPLEPRPTDRSFAHLLASAGLSSIHFSPRVSSDDFSRLVRAFATRGSKPASLLAQLRVALGEEKDSTIRINEVRFVAQDATLAEAGLAAELAARSLGPEAKRLQAWLEDPQRLLQLIAAAEGAHSKAAGPWPNAASTTSSTPAPQEQDVMSILHLLSQLGQAGKQSDSPCEAAQFERQLNQLPAAAHATLTRALTELAASPPAKPDTPMLLQLAEHVAVRFALECYQRGDVHINAVVELLGRMKREVMALRKVLTTHEEKMSRAGLEVETHADILDRQFWAAVPEHAKQKILLSPEAWAVPPRNVRQLVEELLARSQAEEAGNILLNYTTCVHNPDPGVRRKAALGLTDLVDLYVRVEGSLLRTTIQHLGEQLSRESDAELETLLSAGFVRFSHEAAAQRRYPAVQQTLVSMEGVEKSRPILAHLMWPRVKAGNPLQEFIEDALHAPRIPEGLVEVLRRMPHVTAELAASRLGRCALRDECERLVELAREVGGEGVVHLRKTLEMRPAAEATSTVALLSRLDAASVEELLPERLREWDRAAHDQVVRQLASGGAPERGKLLAGLLDLLDPTVLPEAVDEIGMCGDPAASPGVIQIIEEGLERPEEPYLLIKAIEALGRLREPKALPLLRPLVEAKKLWQWRHPREVRITAAQSLAKIDPDWAKSFLPNSGLSETDLALAPLDPIPDAPWVRQRRYVRIQLPRAVNGAVATPQGNCPIAIEQLSLGGGVAACQRHLKAGSATCLEFPSGLHRLHAEVLVREARPQQLSFELVHINLDDRSKLRRPLAGLHARII